MIMKRTFSFLAALLATAFVLGGCAQMDPESWKRSPSGLGPHPDKEAGSRTNVDF